MKMIPRITNFLRFTYFFILFLPSECDKKPKRIKINDQLPHFHLYPYDILPSDEQITIFLHRGETKALSYISRVKHYSLSITVTACTSPVRWGVKYAGNDTAISINNNNNNADIVTTEMSTATIGGNEGIYNLRFMPTLNDTYLHVYISTEPGGSQALLSGENGKLRLIQRKKKLIVKWKQSPVDPQVTTYCLVYSKERKTSSFCKAQSEKFGLLVPQPRGILEGAHPHKKWRRLTYPSPDSVNEAPGVVCVGKKTQITLDNLRYGNGYYLDLFAINKHSNLTYPYGSNYRRFERRMKRTDLKEDRLIHADLRRSDGRINFRYKAKPNFGRPLHIMVVPCGGAVNVEVVRKDGGFVVSERQIEGVGNLTVPLPSTPADYLVKITASSAEERERISGVKIFATTNLLSTRIPLMPQNMSLHVYQQGCDYLVIGWPAALMNQTLRYCVRAEVGKLKETIEYRMPNQCTLERRLRKSVDSVEICKSHRNDGDNEIITDVIKPLVPNTWYVLQVIVKKQKFKLLSYELLEVHTKRSCSTAIDNYLDD